MGKYANFWVDVSKFVVDFDTFGGLAVIGTYMLWGGYRYELVKSFTSLMGG